MHARFCFLPHRDRIPANSRVHPSFHCLLCLAIMHPAFSIRCAQGAKSPIKAHADGGSTHTRRRWNLPHVHLRHSCLLPKSSEMHLLPPPLALACKTIQSPFHEGNFAKLSSPRLKPHRLEASLSPSDQQLRFSILHASQGSRFLTFNWI